MARKIEIVGVTFEIEQKGLYVRFSNSDKPDVMLCQKDEYSWEIFIHEPHVGAVLDTKESSSKEVLVRWAKSKGYLPY